MWSESGHPSTVRPTRWLAPESPRSAMTGLQITPPLLAHVIVPNVRVKISEKPEFSRNSRPMGREGTCMDYKTTGSPTPEVEKVPSRRGYPRHAFSIRKCAFSVIFVPLFLGKPEFSRHSGACGLECHPSTVRPTRWLAPESPRSAMTGLQITPPTTGTCYCAQCSS